MDDWLDWPDKPGIYWFYGLPSVSWYEKNGLEPELIPVKAGGKAGKIMVHRWAEILFRSNMRGKFLLIDPPSLPDLM